MKALPYQNPDWTYAFTKDDIANQFEGMEVEFDNKVTLFPVQVKKKESKYRLNKASHQRRMRDETFR